jgi:chromosome segregation protein
LKKDVCSREIGVIEGQIEATLKMIRREEEINSQKEFKTVELGVVKDLQKEINRYVGEIEKSRDLDKIVEYAQTIRSLMSAFIEMHQDRIDTKPLVEAKLEIERLTSVKQKLLEDKKVLDLEESNLNLEYDNLYKKIESEKDVNRDAEKELFRLMALKQSLLATSSDVANKELNFKNRDLAFKEDSREFVSILGTEILGFENDVYGIDNFDFGSNRREIERLKIRLEESGVLGASDVLKEYEDTEARDKFLEKEILDLENSAKSLKDLITDLDNKLSEEFTSGLNKINDKFSEFFSLMFGGGSASLNVVTKNITEESLDISNLEDVEDVSTKEENYGIDIDVSLPRKKVRGLIQLSGGERALTSIALLFAISQVNPPPFIILDETDAALDEANSKKYGDMIEKLSKYSQLIVITHNRETMSRAGVLYGITMGQGGVSKLLSVAFEEAITVAK